MEVRELRDRKLKTVKIRRNEMDFFLMDCKEIVKL